MINEWTFYYLVIYKCMGISVRVNSTVQFTYFLAMALNITTVSSYDSLIVVLATYFFHH